MIHFWSAGTLRREGVFLLSAPKRKNMMLRYLFDAKVSGRKSLNRDSNLSC